MPFENISLQSAGSLSVAMFALFMTILQSLFFFRKTQSNWHAWSAAICFSAMIYALGVFFEYNTPRGSLNRFAGLMEWTALILLIHSIFGFTFSYLSIENRLYHKAAGVFHALILFLLWTGDALVADTFVVRHFIGLSAPYVEAGLGPLGPLFVAYVALSGIVAVGIWLRTKTVNGKYRGYYLAGLGTWLLLGFHDGLAALGHSPFQYVMEYGFLAFVMAVLWLVFNRYLEITAEEQYRVITDFANDCILVIQEDNIVFQNPACNDLVGKKSEDPTLDNFLHSMAPTDRGIALDNYRSLLSADSGPQTHTVRICREGGEERFVEIVASRIHYWNRPAVLTIMRDMTDRFREEEIRRENEKKMARLEKMESLGLLAGGVAHDLNNVLSGIVTYPDLILSDLDAESKFRKPIETMQKAGQKAAAIVQDLLTLARRSVQSKSIVNLNQVISDYLESAEHEKLLSFHLGVELRTRLDPDLLNTIGSAVHLSKTVMNLVSNAAEAMPGGGRITIETANRHVDHPLAFYDSIRQGDYVMVRVSDTGVGLSEKERERIFEPFYTKKVMGRSGTGLGMAVVWGTVKDHQGYIDIGGAKNKGAIFTLYFPATREKLPASPFSSSEEIPVGKGETILAVDDMETQREIVTAILTRLGYRAVAVPSGEAAVEYLKQNRVDLLILDMIMDPGMDGLDTYQQALAIRPGQKAIIASGFSETDRVREAKKLGAGPYVKKPYTLKKIGEAVRAELGRRGNESR